MDFEYINKNKEEYLLSELIFLSGKMQNFMNYLKSTKLKGIKYKE